MAQEKSVQRYVNNLRKRGVRVIIRKIPFTCNDVPNYLKRLDVFERRSRSFNYRIC